MPVATALMRFKAKVDWWIGVAIAAGLSLPLADAILIVRAALTTRRIPYAEIAAVRQSSDSRSSLALSLDRVLIEYGTRELLIAPRDRDAFFAELAARAPQLSR